MPDGFGPTNADIHEDQAFQAFHTFMRGSRRFLETQVWEQTYRAYRDATATLEEAPETGEAALPVLDRIPQFQIYSWMFRNLQRFKYCHPSWGIVPAAQAERSRIEAALAASVSRGVAQRRLRLDPEIAYPDYYRYVDFHQHPGGVWSDPLDGLVYDVARRTTIPGHMDPNTIYRQLFASLPQGRNFDRVLDWGTGHGAGLHSWMEANPGSEAHGVDLSAPCLAFSWKKAEERGLAPMLSQQDIAHLDYPDNHFDLIFFVFMLHEIPPGPTPGILREVYRVLKPGGLFFGAEFRPLPVVDAFEHAMIVNSQWCNNEVFSPAFFKFPFIETAREIGFSRAEIYRFDRLTNPPATSSPEIDRAPPFSEPILFDFEK